MSDQESRERALIELAQRLRFEVEKQGARFSLHRDLPDEADAVQRDGLTLEEAEQFLNKWKLRGLHGG